MLRNTVMCNQSVCYGILVVQGNDGERKELIGPVNLPIAISPFTGAFTLHRCAVAWNLLLPFSQSGMFV